MSYYFPMQKVTHHRRSIRLRGFDYTSGGQYFVTICTRNKDCLFGEVINDQIQLNEEGKIVWDCWMDIPRHFPNVIVYNEAFVVMPNHIHGIVEIAEGQDVNCKGKVCESKKMTLDCRGKACINEKILSDCRGVACYAPTEERMSVISPKPSSLGVIIRSFKSAVSQRINQLWDTPGQTIWQRNYFEHVIRNEKELEKICTYILNNPSSWPQDEENPIHHVRAQHASPSS